MAGMPPPPPADSGGAGMNLHPWMHGPNAPGAPSMSGPQAPQAHISGNSSSSGPMPPRLPGLGVSGPPPSYGPPVQMQPMQFRPAGPPQTGQQYLPPSNQQFRPMVPPPSMTATMTMPPSNVPVAVGPSNASLQLQNTQYLPPRPNQQPQPMITSQGLSFNQQQRPVTAGQLPQPSQPPSMPPPGVGVTPPPTFTFVPSASYTQNNFGATHVSFQASASQHQVHHMQSTSQPWPGLSNQTSALGASQVQQNPLAVNSALGPMPPVAPPPAGFSDWQEHTAPDGRKYYYNKKTKQSSWEKPFELMTPVERADASTVWKEFTTADGRKYYYNKLTKQSKWTMPEDMKAAREKVEKAATASSTPAIELLSAVAKTPPAVTSTTTSSSPLIAPSSPLPVSTATAPSASEASAARPTTPGGEISAVVEVASPPVHTSAEDTTTIVNPEIKTISDNEDVPKKGISEEASAQDIEEAKKTMPLVGNVNVTPLVKDKPAPIAEEPPTYANKVEAKNAFKELLEAVHVEADWTWEQAMRVIINDKRYGALKTLGERKQAFNEYLSYRKKHEAEEKRIKQKRAREEFLIMLQESKQLTSTMRWSKAVSLFAEDPRLLAVEKDREREELFEDYLVELERKERERAREERKKNVIEYRAFLESCDFIKANTQWRKVADKLEVDERCSRLDKMDRLDVFQEYIRDLEKEEEEEKKNQREQQRKNERKHRDDFRKLMEDHRESGVLTTRVAWRDYVLKVKEHPAYLAVCSNTSGTTPKELFEDVAEDMEKQYQADKSRIKETIKAGKINVTPAWTFDKFKSAIVEAGDLTGIAESNVKLVFEDLLDRAKEKEEKEAKKKKRLVDDFNEVLRTEKSLTVSSKWEDCKLLLENATEFRALSDESARKKLFDEYIAHLQQKTKEKEKKREEEKAKKDREKEKEKEKEREKKKEKEKKEKEREKDKSSKKEKEVHADGTDNASNHISREERRKDKEKERDREKEKDRKHRKHHRSKSSDEGSSEKDAKEETKRSRKHSSDKRKSSRKHGHESASDSENRHKRHKRDRDIFRRNGTIDDLEDGELGEDGEIR